MKRLKSPTGRSKRKLGNRISQKGKVELCLPFRDFAKLSEISERENVFPEHLTNFILESF